MPEDPTLPPKLLETPLHIPPPKLKLLDKLSPHQLIKLPLIPPPNQLLLVAPTLVETHQFIKDKLPTVKFHKIISSSIKLSKPQPVDIQLWDKV